MNKDDETMVIVRMELIRNLKSFGSLCLSSASEIIKYNKPRGLLIIK